MAETKDIRESTTAALDMQLLSDGSAIDLTGYDHVEMRMLDSKKQVYRYSSTDSSTYVTIVTASSGTVRFSPPSGNTFLYQHSPYYLYWWAYPTSTTKFSIPENGHAIINVLKDY